MRTIRKTVLSMMLLLAGMSASAQETQFLSNNHCLYRIHQSEKSLLIPVQESAEMSHVKVIANNQQLKTFNVPPCQYARRLLCASSIWRLTRARRD